MPTDVFKIEQSVPGAGVPTGIIGLNSIFFTFRMATVCWAENGTAQTDLEFGKNIL